MKIITTEEREAHATFLAIEGAKGLFYGSLVSMAVFNFLRVRHPARFKSFSTSIKTCILILPACGCCGFSADRGSVVFDRRVHSYGRETKVLEEFRRWKRMSTPEKTINILNDNKYKVLLGTWVGSMFGVWTYLESGKIMNATQKATKMRNFSLTSTSILVVGLGSFIWKEKFANKKESSETNAKDEATEN